MLFSEIMNGEHRDVFMDSGLTYKKNKCVAFHPYSSKLVSYNGVTVYCIMHKKGDDEIILLLDPCVRKYIPINDDFKIMVRYT